MTNATGRRFLFFFFFLELNRRSPGSGFKSDLLCRERRAVARGRRDTVCIEAPRKTSSVLIGSMNINQEPSRFAAVFYDLCHCGVYSCLVVVRRR